jgi:hypothetical protein
MERALLPAAFDFDLDSDTHPLKTATHLSASSFVIWYLQAGDTTLQLSHLLRPSPPLPLLHKYSSLF